MNPPAVPGVLLPLEHVEEAVASAGDLAVADVHAHGVGRGERAAYVPLWLRDDDVHLWREHAPQSHGHAEAHRERRGDDLVVAAEVDRHKGEPNDARGVHGEGDVLGFVEIGGNVAGLECIVGAAHDEQTVVAQWRHNAEVAGVADQKHFSDAWVGFDWFRRLHDDKRNFQHQLKTDKYWGDDHLSPRAHEPRLPGADLLLAARQDASDAIGFGHECGVTHGGWESDEKSLKVAGRHCGSRYEGERAQVSKEDPSQDNVAELTAGWLHHRRVTVQDEDEGYEWRNQDAQAGKDNLDDWFWIAPLEVVQGNWFATWRENKSYFTYYFSQNSQWLFELTSNIIGILCDRPTLNFIDQ